MIVSILKLDHIPSSCIVIMVCNNMVKVVNSAPEPTTQPLYTFLESQVKI